jgi:hypothetical protein
MPAVGMALLLTDALVWIDGRLARAIGRRARLAVVSVLAAFIAVRFMLFASENIANFVERTDPYRELAVRIRQEYPARQPAAEVPVDRQTADALQFRYVEALAQWELRDPAVRVAVRN